MARLLPVAREPKLNVLKMKIGDQRGFNSLRYRYDVFVTTDTGEGLKTSNDGCR
jgi:hypothetical protein